VVDESSNRMTVIGLLSNRMMMALCILLNRAIVMCMTFDSMALTGALFERLTSTLSIIACRRLDAAELWLAEVFED